MISFSRVIQNKNFLLDLLLVNDKHLIFDVQGQANLDSDVTTRLNFMFLRNPLAKFLNDKTIKHYISQQTVLPEDGSIRLYP